MTKSFHPMQAGERSKVYSEVWTRDSVRDFAQATGFSGLEFPPTIPTRLRQGEFELFQKLGIPLASVLHAEQSYRWISMPKLPFTLQYETELTRVSEKSGSKGKLTFLIFETQVKSAQTVFVVSETTVVIREEASA